MASTTSPADSRKLLPGTDAGPSTQALGRLQQDTLDYAVDAWQRSLLFLDVMRERGNVFLEHLRGGKPALLDFGHELLVDGATLPRPCNYSLLRILPPAETKVDDAKRPIVIVDPRAGHGPGIGGFKPDSEIGMALRAGHPVYFITFAPEPVDGQTLLDVARAQAHFIAEVMRRHPRCGCKPAVIGNCQAGWAVAALASVRGDIMGPIVLNGAPLSYWAGSPKQNPMRYAGGLQGGAWMAALASDLSGDRFDGAFLVDNFERLNLGNTFWGKYYKLYANVDTERERFLEFERWWGGYFRMTGEEIEAIVENLFVGNKLARDEVVMEGIPVHLRNITSPIVIFASWGDNITPPQQALDWIIDVWGSERALVAAGRTIVYMLHNTIGHLGIFVGGATARKEHDQIINTLDMIDGLPPGLYEMRIEAKDGKECYAELEPGNFSVRFETRTVDDIRALNPGGRRDEAMFSTVAQLSEINLQAYRTWMQPWVRLAGSKPLGDALRWLHPLRQQHLALSDFSPAAPWIRQAAQTAREHRRPAQGDNGWSAWEHVASQWITDGLNLVGGVRDDTQSNWVTLAYGPQGLGAVLPPHVSDELAALARAEADEDQARRVAEAHAGKGGFAEAVCRILLLGLSRRGAVERRGWRLGELLCRSHHEMSQHLSLPSACTRAEDWQKLIDGQALVVTFAREEAVAALPRMLPRTAEREQAVALAAAVLMAEPELADPQSPASRLVHATLGVDPARVAALALSLSQTVATAEARGQDRPVRGVSPPAGAAPAKAAAKPTPGTPRKAAARPAAKRKPAARAAT